ncbi:MAG: hypothetical protein KI793_23650 [Rivularia sp. (in: Bacteria)]|nr:hypothetical protein [Rivularia sp. MS3]
MSRLTSNFKRKYFALFSLGIISASIAFVVPLRNEINTENIAIAQTQKPKPKPKPKPNSRPRRRRKASPLKRLIGIFDRHRPKTLGARSISNICPVAPGFIETYTVWHTQPLFLWVSTLKNQEAQKNQEAKLVVRERHSDSILWEQKVNIADQKVFYSGQPLEPGKLYQWRLEGTFSSNSWATFEIMPANQHAQIQADLQRLAQKSQSKANSEQMAIQKAEYFFTYLTKPQTKDYLWSDGLQALYQVEKPSEDFLRERDILVANRCTPSKEVVNREGRSEGVRE